MIVRDENDFRQEFAKINAFVDRSAELPHQVFRLTLAGLYFVDFDDLWRSDIFEMLCQAGTAVEARHIVLAVLKPDPVEYYFENFRRFPLLKFETIGQSPEAFIHAIHEDPGGSPADAVVHNSDVVVIYADNMRWLIYGDRNLEVGLLGTADEQATRVIESSLPARLHSARFVVDNVLPTVFRGTVPSSVREELLRNYEKAGMS